MKRRRTRFASLEGRINRLARLKADAPVRYFLVGRIPGKLGDCQRRRGKNGPYYRIRISTVYGEEAAIQVAIHEHAHSLTWRNADHGPAWGRAFARCYRAAMRCK